MGPTKGPSSTQTPPLLVSILENIRGLKQVNSNKSYNHASKQPETFRNVKRIVSHHRETVDGDMEYFWKWTQLQVVRPLHTLITTPIYHHHIVNTSKRRCITTRRRTTTRRCTTNVGVARRHEGEEWRIGTMWQGAEEENGERRGWAVMPISTNSTFLSLCLKAYTNYSTAQNERRGAFAPTTTTTCSKREMEDFVQPPPPLHCSK